MLHLAPHLVVDSAVSEYDLRDLAAVSDVDDTQLQILDLAVFHHLVINIVGFADQQLFPDIRRCCLHRYGFTVFRVYPYTDIIRGIPCKTARLLGIFKLLQRPVAQAVGLDTVMV